MTLPWQTRTFREVARFDPVTAIAIAGTAISAVGSIAQGGAQSGAMRAQAQQSDYQAKVLQQNAGQARATSQAQAVVERRNAAYAMSRARAVAAASGGGATDPTVVNVEAKIGQQGEYNALSRLYSGEEAARGMEGEASLKQYEATQYETGADTSMATGMIGAVGQALSGTSSLMKGGGPPAAGPPAASTIGGGAASGTYPTMYEHYN